MSAIRPDTSRKAPPTSHLATNSYYANVNATKVTSPVENEERVLDARVGSSASEEGVRHCIVCSTTFAPAMSNKEKEEHVNACLATFNSNPDQECPVCKRVFAADFPASKLTEHVNSHFTDSEPEPYILVSNNDRGS